MLTAHRDMIAIVQRLTENSLGVVLHTENKVDKPTPRGEVSQPYFFSQILMPLRASCCCDWQHPQQHIKYRHGIIIVQLSACTTAQFYPHQLTSSQTPRHNSRVSKDHRWLPLSCRDKIAALRKENLIITSWAMLLAFRLEKVIKYILVNCCHFGE